MPQINWRRRRPSEAFFFCRLVFPGIDKKLRNLPFPKLYATHIALHLRSGAPKASCNFNLRKWRPLIKDMNDSFFFDKRFSFALGTRNTKGSATWNQSTCRVAGITLSGEGGTIVTAKNGTKRVKQWWERFRPWAPSLSSWKQKYVRVRVTVVSHRPLAASATFSCPWSTDWSLSNKGRMFPLFATF